MSLDRERLARAYDKGFQEAGRRIAAPFDRFDKFERQMFLQAIDAVISEIASQGYAIVPREPTEAIIRAVDAGLHEKWPNARSMATSAYAAMIKAASTGGAE